MSLTIYYDYFNRLDMVRQSEEKALLLQDGIYTFSNKVNSGNYCGMQPVNFLAENIQDSLFFRKLAKNKTKEQMEKDTLVTDKFMKDNGFTLVSGFYTISPVVKTKYKLDIMYGNLYLTQNDNTQITISDTTESGIYEIYNSKENQVLSFNVDAVNSEMLFGAGRQLWGSSNIPLEQAFIFKPVENNSFIIEWNNEYALTYEINNSINQIWKIKRTRIQQD